MLALKNIHPSFNGVKSSVLRSETLGIPVIHGVDNGTLYFIVPTETELQGDYLGKEFTFIPLEEDDYIFKDNYIYEPSVNINMPIRLSTFLAPWKRPWHPLIFEGITSDNLSFKVSIILGMKSYATSINFIGNGHEFDWEKEEEQEAPVQMFIFGEMRPYGVVTEINPLRLDIIDSTNWQELSFTFYTNTIPSYEIVIDNKTKSLVFDNNTEALLAKKSPISVIISGNIFNKYDNGTINLISFKDLGIELVFFSGPCSIDGKVELYKEDINKYAVLRCDGGYYGIHKVTQRQKLDRSGMFHFDSVPDGIGCRVEIIGLDSTYNTANFKKTCPDDGPTAENTDEFK
jgi:hypothetical protein